MSSSSGGASVGVRPEDQDGFALELDGDGLQEDGRAARRGGIVRLDELDASSVLSELLEERTGLLIISCNPDVRVPSVSGCLSQQPAYFPSLPNALGPLERGVLLGSNRRVCWGLTDLVNASCSPRRFNASPLIHASTSGVEWLGSNNISAPSSRVSRRFHSFILWPLKRWRYAITHSERPLWHRWCSRS